ncbi:hypothetical protein CBL_08664 [Carabus blaptoides fortunei]
METQQFCYKSLLGSKYPILIMICKKNDVNGIWESSNISFTEKSSRRCLGEIEHSAYSSIELANVDFSAPTADVDQCGRRRRMWILRLLLYRLCFGPLLPGN